VYRHSYATVNHFYKFIYLFSFYRISYLVSGASLQENLCYKTFFMTRYIFFSIFFLLVVLISSDRSFAGTNAATAISVSDSKEAVTDIPVPSKETIPALPSVPATKQQNHGGKVHPPRMEELPHIHHFHKERVKRVKKHHGKVWMIVKLIVILCHIGLLICGYLHATH
jgi:hypothetical protein